MPAPDDPDGYAVDDVIADKYRLVRRIGTGGMGTVWLARNENLNVDVALKLIRSDIESEGLAARLLQEARAAARLEHRSIVRIHDFGETNRGDPYIVMELLDGTPLAVVLGREKRLGPALAVQALLPIISALSLAHRRGIVHRDLKPENIILVEDEVGNVVPKLVDFGIARLQSLPTHPNQTGIRVKRDGKFTSRITQVGALIGSPEYMSPEQATGDIDVDGRADVWALSVVLYQTLSGEMPFTGDSEEDLMLDIHLSDPAPLHSPLWAIVKRGLHKERDQRWSSMRQMGEALATWLVAEGIDTDLAGTSVRRHWLGAHEPRTLDLPDGAPSERAPALGKVGSRAAAPALAAPIREPATSSLATSRAKRHHAQERPVKLVLRVGAGVAVGLLLAWLVVQF